MQTGYCEPEGCYLLGQGEYEGITVDAVLARFKAATGAKTRIELADWLGVRQSLVSDVRRRNIFPARWLRLLLERQTYCNPVWVLTGRGEAYTEK